MMRVATGFLISIVTGLWSLAMAEEGYRLPPPDITDIVLRSPPPGFSLSPDKTTLLLLERESLPPVAELARPMERLAGLRLDAATNDRHGPRRTIGLALLDVETGTERAIDLPANADIDDLAWSPDGRFIAFAMTEEDGVFLWVVDVAKATARRALKQKLNPIFEGPNWLADGRIAVLTVPADRGPQPEEPLTPTGPAISVASGGEEAQTRTYQDLLKNPHDEALFRWLATSQMMTVEPTGRGARKIGAPGIYTSVSDSPDGRYWLVEELAEPFSYQVPWSRFATHVKLWSRGGEVLETLAAQPLADNLPVQGVVTGPRGFGWHPAMDAALLWVEALDGGDPRVEADERDRLMLRDLSEQGAPTEIARFEDRYAGWYALDGLRDLVVADYDRDTREIRRRWIDPSGTRAPVTIEFRDWQDAYADPGDPVYRMTRAGDWLAVVADGALLMEGLGATDEGYRPFLRRFSLADQSVREIWRNGGESFEYVIDALDAEGASFVTFYEDPATPGRLHLHAGGETAQLMSFPDPHPELTGISRELITYTRDDGVPLSATLYLPPGYQEGDTLPVVVWAYPREFNSAATAGQVRDSRYRFTRIGGYSHLFFLTRGYAVMDRAAMPVVGDDPETVNDTFIQQIVASAQAAVDETVARGFGDGERVGVGGHSYGAFMTAHLLARSDIFRAGIARSGAYNRTLTPFGFQAERRIFWDAPEVYYKLSPFMAADQINEPVLFIHGEKDNNSGTFPQQSERMFAAVKGTGGTAKLVMLPHESHGYRGRESVLHTLAEMIEWFDTHVKGDEAEAE